MNDANHFRPDPTSAHEQLAALCEQHGMTAEAEKARALGAEVQGTVDHGQLEEPLDKVADKLACDAVTRKVLDRMQGEHFEALKTLRTARPGQHVPWTSVRPGNVASRYEVFGVINQERTYQDRGLGNARPGEATSRQLSIGEIILFTEECVQRARMYAYHPDHYPQALDQLRKVAALSVQAMERFGAPARDLGEADTSGMA